ncbi:MAG: cold shock domain-containing protein [Coleofasciculus sp. S288]|nr:cold shock domain-containing protein [Coleofasciculus sp. S288]
MRNSLEKTDDIEALVHEKVAKLEKFSDRLNSCRVAIEKIHDRPSSGSPYRVRIDMTVPGQELVADSSPGEGIQYTALEVVIRDAFDAARRQLQEITQRQRREVKSHPAQEMTAIVSKLFRDEGFGFIKTFDDREVYFHRNSVLHDDFDRLEIGVGVHFFLEDGVEGPQASTVKIVDKPGVRTGKSAGYEVEPPLGWE